MSNFISLHTHSCFSPQDGAQSVKQIAEKTAAFGMNAVALTDHGRCGGLLAFKKECEKVKVKPIYGLEAYVAPQSRVLKEKIDGEKTAYHLTLLAKTDEGLRNLFRLTSIAWQEGFYYKPRVDMEVLKKHSEGLVVLSGCGSGKLPYLLMQNRVDDAENHIKEMLSIWKENFYIEVQNHGIDWQLPLKDILFRYSEYMSVPIVATQDSHYPTRDDADLHRAICKLAAGDLEFEGNESYFKPYNDMCKMFTAQERHAIDRTQEVADKCNCNWQYGKTIWPVYDLPNEETPEQRLRSITYAGFAKKFGDGAEEYKQRIEYELEVISRMGFPTYFLVVADFINWAKGQGIAVGPGRGSGAGSLVCYCTGITDVDPIKYGLYFERFLNPSRVSLPDIDTDIDKQRRSEVTAYITEKYGSNKVAQIGTYASFKPRGSLKDFARVLGHPIQLGEELAAMVPPDVAGKSLVFDKVIEARPDILNPEYSDVVTLARAAEGLISQAGIHAAGIVISDTDITDYVPLFRGKHDEIATQFDMHDIEEVGLVKYDLLGLKNLTVIQEAIRLIKQNHGIEINISSIDESDQKVFKEIFQQGKLAGIFQFETSSGFRDLCIKVKPESIDDLSTITALFRPGPLDTGLVTQYVDRKNGASFEYLVPELEPSLKVTYGVMVFQEQIMRICTEVAGYTLAEADNMRKIIGKKLPEKMKLEREKFVGGCIENNISEMAATQLFDDIEGFALYSFNKSHSVAYSIVSYQTAWLKTYYKEEFYCALFNSSLRDQDDLVKYFYAAKEDGIHVQPPDVNISESKFVVNNGSIIFGLAGVKGLGEKACEQIIALRPENGFKSIDHMISCGLNKGAIKALAACGAMSEILDIPRAVLLYNIEDIMKYHEKMALWEEREKSIAQRMEEIRIAVEEGRKPPRRLPKNKDKPEPPTLMAVPDEVQQDRLVYERETLGFYLTGHPMDNYPGLMRQAKYTVQNIKEGKVKNGERIKIPVVVSSLIEKRTRKGQDMAVLTIEDQTGRIEATIFPKGWARLSGNITVDAVSIVDGTIRVTEGEEDAPPMVRIVVNDVRSVEADNIGGQTNVISIDLSDGTKVEFFPTDCQNYSQYQQAIALVSNIKRMG